MSAHLTLTDMEVDASHATTPVRTQRHKGDVGVTRPRPSAHQDGGRGSGTRNKSRGYVQPQQSTTNLF